jgi:replicative DNA helicase
MLLDDVPDFARDDVPGIDEGARLRIPPHSLEAEHGVLGSLLQDNTALAVVGDLVAADSFYVAAHRWIYAAITDLLAQRIPADAITVYEQLVQRDQADACDGLPYLLQIEQGVPSARNARQYAEIVAERAADGHAAG